MKSDSEHFRAMAVGIIESIDKDRYTVDNEYAIEELAFKLRKMLSIEMDNFWQSDIGRVVIDDRDEIHDQIKDHLFSMECDFRNLVRDCISGIESTLGPPRAINQKTARREDVEKYTEKIESKANAIKNRIQSLETKEGKQ